MLGQTGLTAGELVEALALDEDGDTNTIDRSKTFADGKGLRRTCRSLVEYDSKSGFIKLCHKTVEV